MNARILLLMSAVLLQFSFLVGLTLILSRLPKAAAAATITVDTTDDDSAANGNCTLREAVIAANTDTAVDTCLAGSGPDHIIFGVSGTIVLGSALPAVIEDLTISGPGAANLTISGNDAVRVLDVVWGTSLQLHDLTIAEGYAQDDFGGAIRNNGSLTISNSTISGSAAWGGGGLSNLGLAILTNVDLNGNSAGDPFGGGGISNGGTLTVTYSTLSGNSSDSIGGGIYNNGFMYIENVTFDGNSAAQNGGGVFSQNVAYFNSITFAGNTADVSGGGIYGSGGWLEVSNSTFSGNHAQGIGGAIMIHSATFTITSSTLSDNSNSSGLDGGSIYNVSGTALLRNTIVAGSTVGGNCSGPVTDGDGNLSWPDNTCPGINNHPLLAPLANYGGLTETHALLPWSAAIDNAVSANCPATDQRGVARVGPCDIGAYEYDPNDDPLSHLLLPVIIKQ